MTVFRFITNSLLYFRRQHLAVFAATVIAAAALTGALVIGDSVRYSLKRSVGERLGKTRMAVVSGSRFIRARLAHDLESATGTKAAPVLLLNGIAINPQTAERFNTVQVLGIDPAFRDFAPGPQPAIGPGEALVSLNVAQRLKLVNGDQFLLRIEKTGLIPVNVIYSRDEGTSLALRLTVAGIAGDSALGKFSLRNNQAAPGNIFISREFLAQQMELDSLVNLILVGDSPAGISLEKQVRSVLKKHWELRDASLRITVEGETGIFDLTSNRIFIDDTVSSLITKLQVPHKKILTYLVNRFEKEGRETPYSFIASFSPPVEPKDTGNNGMLINRWLAEDLDAEPGDTVTLEYFVIGPWRNLSSKNTKFVVSGIIPTDGSTASRMLMPFIPGLSDAGSCRDWNSGVPVDLGRIRDKDEQYWNQYRGSPKAYVSFQAGRDLWHNQFGSCTAIRFDEKDITADSLAELLLDNLNPADFGIETILVRNAGMAAAENSVDFGSLFLYLSFFVIAGSVLLIVLIHALNTEMRRSETGVLAGLGYTRSRIAGIRLAESAPVIVSGGLAGAFAGIAYNHFLLAGLNTIWQDAVNMNALSVHIRWQTLVVGALAGTLLALVSVAWVTRRMLRNPVLGLLRQVSGTGQATLSMRYKRSRIIAAICSLASLALVIWSVITGAYQDAGLFMTAGSLFLAACIFFLFYLMARPEHGDKLITGLFWMAWKNAGRIPARSMAVILILSIGVFSVILTGAYRKTFSGTEDQVKSGTGGYQLWAETTLPVPVDLNSEAGRNRLVTEKDSDLAGVRFLQFHSLEGDDASCLNLNQVEKPRILGVLPGEFDRRGAFSFARLARGFDREHPWKSLDREYGHGIYPAFADQTVIQYGLKRSVGDTLTYLNEYGKPFHLILAGGLENSIFQGNLLISDSFLRKEFPSTGGSRIMLVEAPVSKPEVAATVLKNSLPDYGIEVTSAPARLAEFNSVENTYLTVFMMLGGLGLLIGTFGLGFLLARNILERKHELALLIAVGYRKKMLIRLIWTEYFLLLLAGVICGSLSALIGILPSFITPSFTMQPGFLVAIVLLILLSGSLWISLSARHILSQDLIPALREDQ